MANDRRRRLAALEAVKANAVHEGATRTINDLLERYGDRELGLCDRIRAATDSETRAIAICDLLDAARPEDREQFWRTAKAVPS